MADTDPNVTIDISGDTANIATDYPSSGVTNGHVQLVKPVWGGTTYAYRVSNEYPFPISLKDSITLGITGSVGSLGNYKIVNGLSGITSIPLIVSGTTASGYAPVQISGNIQGITNGVLVGITGTINLGNTYMAVVGISGGQALAVTGGRPLTSARDSVTVTGYVGLTGSTVLLPAFAGVRAYGADGSTGVYVNVRDGSGNSISSSGGALNVNLVGAGITATVTISPVVGISQANQAVPLFIAGATAGPDVRIKGGLSGGAVEVGWSNALPVSISGGSSITVNNTDLISAINNLPIDNIDTNATTLLTRVENILTRLGGTFTTTATSVIPSTVYTGESTIGGLTAAVQLNSATLKSGVTVRSLTSNSATGTDLKVKATTGASGYFYLSPGESIFIAIDNLNKITLESGNSGVAVRYCYIAS